MSTTAYLGKLASLVIETDETKNKGKNYAQTPFRT